MTLTLTLHWHNTDTNTDTDTDINTNTDIDTDTGDSSAKTIDTYAPLVPLGLAVCLWRDFVTQLAYTLATPVGLISSCSNELYL